VVAPAGSEGFHWVVHRRAAPVAFLATPLMGLGPGEELDVHVIVEAGGSVVVTSQGPTALLKTASVASQRWMLRLDEGSHLTFLPWLTIPYPGSRSRAELAAELSTGASLVAWETIAVGRIGTGERFLFEELRSTCRIAAPSGLLLHDRIAVRGADRAHAETMLGGYTHLGTLYVAGVAENALAVDSIRQALESRVELVGVGRPDPLVLVARALDTSAERLEHAFFPAVNAAREAAGQPSLTPGDVARRWFA
jgi:urease accessory protein